MGQNGSSVSEKRRSKTRINAPPEFGGATNSGPGRRSTLSGAPTRRHSTFGSGSPQTPSPHRRAASSASHTIQAAHRANNIASQRNSPMPLGHNIASQPPAYSSNGSAENALELLKLSFIELLKEYDTVFLIDDSGSMAGGLWTQAGRALAGVATVASQYDDDGIDIYFLNSREFAQNVRHESQVYQLFQRVQPRGSTPTGARLDILLRSYLTSIERAQEEFDSQDPEITGIKPVNYIVITDGAPSDDPESVIVAAAKRLDKGEFPLSQVGIQFVQIGSDPEATQALEELDDDLAGKYDIRDIVDTTPYTTELSGETLIKILLGGVNKRVDRRGGGAVMR
ncbi:VWA domain-containing protein [Rhizoctonia solani]|uniref:VWA domain-containing protein n=1 Tax=Rhizoctonia solani TaxID=456999 RepID=A0A8H8NP60_9AGAM|nr:VWA domain-containing protein [Rhizoctonia solani]QRW15767.1 VWA domain-containing protein [Rhizoctonia solani]